MNPDRRYDIDWIRVLAFSLLILYHTGLFFVDWNWHLTNPVTSRKLEYGMQFSNHWRLSLLFLISGIGVSFALKKRSFIKFSIERTNRLLLPLIVCTLIFIPPQIFIERIHTGAFAGSYLQFFPHFFDGVYPKGNFSLHHLWFILYLFVFSIISIPFFSFSMSESGKKIFDSFTKLIAHPLALYALFIPIAISEVLLRPSWPSTLNITSDWANLSTYLIVFLTGYTISTRNNIWLTIATYRKVWLGLGIFLFTFLMIYFGSRYSEKDQYFRVYLVIKYANAWAWILTCLGFANVYLNKESTFIIRANRAVYPFYITHQTLTLIYCYWLYDWNPGIPLKFAVISFLTFAGCYLIYKLLISRFKVIGFFFGLKPEQPASLDIRNETKQPSFAAES